MTSTLLKYNVILIVLCIGMTLIHNSSGEKIKKNINLYYDPQSPPCRAVLLTLEALNLEFNLIHVHLLQQETRNENFLKINPLHTVPVMEDGAFRLVDSHAIIVYLVEVFGEDHNQELYPNDPKLQARVNERLHFDNGNLFPAFTSQYNPWIYYGVAKTPEREDKIHEGLRFLEGVLETSPWIAGDSMTVADFSLVATVSTCEVAGVDMKDYRNIKEWIKKCESKMHGYEAINQKGINIIKEVMKAMDKKFNREEKKPST